MINIETVIVTFVLALIFFAGVGMALAGFILDRTIDPDDDLRWTVKNPTLRRKL